MTTEERERIQSLGRKRGAELAHTVAGKATALRALGWPAAVQQARGKRAA